MRRAYQITLFRYGGCCDVTCDATALTPISPVSPLAEVSPPVEPFGNPAPTGEREGSPPGERSGDRLISPPEVSQAMRTLIAASAIAMATLAGPRSWAQEPRPALSPTLTFEVASVKVNESQTRTPMRWLPGGRFIMGLPVQVI